MKLRVVPLVIVLLVCVVISGCDFLNPLNRLATGEFLLSDVDSDINTPDWLDGKTLIATTGYSPNLIELGATGAIRQTHVIGIADITRMNTLSASPDATLVVFRVRYEGLGYDPDNDNYEETDYTDILVYNVASGATTNLTNGMILLPPSMFFFRNTYLSRITSNMFAFFYTFMRKYTYYWM